jgi:hypothetical protein
MCLATSNACAAAPASSLDVREITMTRYLTSGPVAHPAHHYVERFVFRADGTAIYVGGHSWVKRTGRHKGKVSATDFARMAALLREGRFFAMKNTVGQRDTKSGGSDYRVDVTATRSEGAHHLERKMVTAWGAYRPRPHTLRKVAQIMDGLLWKVKWQRDNTVDAVSRGLSGIRGDVQIDDGKRITDLANALVILRTVDRGGKEVARTRSDHTGNFLFQVPPGQYRIVPAPNRTFESLESTTSGDRLIRVKPYEFRPTRITVRRQ